MKTSPNRLDRAPRRRRLLLVLGAWSVATTSACALAAHASLGWNSTESLPVGLYARRPLAGPPARGQLVALTVPSTAAQLVAERDYLHGGSQQLFKRVLAIPGDNVCLLGDVYTVNGEVIGAILGADRQGRALRPWQFCGMVGADTYWVGTRAPRSFDSRYFGPVRASAFLAGLEPWWTF